jgi:hypothetical protein
VRSNSFIKSPWQLREFKTDINAKGEVVFVADTVKSNPLTNLFADENNADSDSLKSLKTDFDRDFDAYADNLLAPERRASNPSSRDIINGFSLDNDDSYNEFQSDASDNDNTAKGKNKNLNTIINKKLKALKAEIKAENKRCRIAGYQTAETVRYKERSTLTFNSLFKLPCLRLRL